MDTFNLNKYHTETSQENIAKPPVFKVGRATDRSPGDFLTIERRSRNHRVFEIDDPPFISSLPRATHWSIAWSDLMMTMFILFLSMFVYQAANEEFLGEKAPEILGGDTTGALESIDTNEVKLPFAPIHPGLPLMTAGTIKKVEPVHTDVISAQSTADKEREEEQNTKEQINADFEPKASMSTSQEQLALILPENHEVPATPKNSITIQPPEEVLEPLPLGSAYPVAPQQTSFQEIYVLGKNALEDNNLNKFATIDLVPDKTMRIVLTSDLLFATGKSELSAAAKNSLRKVARILQVTPYIINVVGHTDNVPMHSYKFESNWELSVARATTVTRFFIDEIGMDPVQFVVSGYSSYRPILPNINAENRAKNRRVEIIISKKLPNPAPLTTKNLQ